MGTTTRTPKGTPHAPLVRRLVSGRKVARDHEGARPVAGRQPYTRQAGAGVQRAAVLFADVPARSRVLVEVAGPVPGQPRRRDRRAAARRKPQPIGGGICCDGVTDFYTDEDRERWEELHADCESTGDLPLACSCPDDTPSRQVSEHDVECLGCGQVSA